jgi:hypothetical protein
MALPEDYEGYRNLLMETAVEELGHIEMLATAVTKNLRGSHAQMDDDVKDVASTAAAMTGQNPRQFLSAGQSAMPVDSNGVPFSGGYVVASGNLAGDLYANVMAEGTGRTLATRLYEYTDDPGMRDMLSVPYRARYDAPESVARRPGIARRPRADPGEFPAGGGEPGGQLRVQVDPPRATAQPRYALDAGQLAGQQRRVLLPARTAR